MSLIKMLGSCLLCLGMVFSLEAQNLERKVFSNGGGSATTGPNTYLYTFGEPIVGTANTSTLILTKGFHQPLDISVLPLDIRGLEATWQGAEVNLRWLANLEVGAGFLVVERSQDGQSFENIAELAAQSPEASLVPYQYQDTSVRRLAVKKIWYRITLLSYQGEIKQSNKVAVNLEAISDINFEIYPNPSSGKFQIAYYLEESSLARISLLNHLGQTVWQQKQELAAGQNEVGIQLDQLAKGSYFLIMQTPKQQWTRTLVLQH